MGRINSLPARSTLPEDISPGSSVEVKKNVMTGKKAILLNYDTNIRQGFLIAFDRSKAPVFKSLKRRIFEISISARHARDVKYISMLFLDAQNKIWKFGTSYPVISPGSSVVHIPVTFDSRFYRYSEGHTLSFNDAADFNAWPVKLTGIEFLMTGEEKHKAELYLNSIKELEYDDSDAAPAIRARLSDNMLASDHIPVVRVNKAVQGNGCYAGNGLLLSGINSEKVKVDFRTHDNFCYGAARNTLRLPEMSEVDFEVEFSTAEPVEVKSLRIGIHDAANVVRYFPANIRKQEGRPGHYIAQVSIDLAEKFNGDSVVLWHSSPGEKVTKMMQPLRLLDMDFSFSDSVKDLRIHRITPHMTLAGSAGMQLEVETGNFGRIIEPGQEKNLQVTLTNRLDRPQRFAVEIALRDYKNEYGKWIAVGNMSFAPGETRELPVPQFSKLGFYSVECRLRSLDVKGDKRWITGRSFAYLKPTGNKNTDYKKDFRFGVMCHGPAWPVQEKELIGLTATIGGNYSRGFEDFGSMAKHNIGTDAFMALGDCFSRDENGNLKEVNAQCAIAAIEKSIGRTDWPAGTCWELDNELEWTDNKHFSPENLVKAARILSDYLKEKHPQYGMMTTGFCTFDGSDSFPHYQETAMRKAGNDIFKIHAFHMYDYLPQFFRNIDLFATKRAEWGVSIPWLMNETGANGREFPSTRLPQELVKRAIFAWSRGALGFCWFSLTDHGEDTSYTEDQFGLLTYDLYPKTSLVAYNTMTGVLQTMKFVQTLTPREQWQMQAHLFSDGRQTAVVAWNDNDIKQILKLKSPATEACIVDCMGNRSHAEKDKSGNWVLPVTGYPIYLVLTGNVPVELVTHQ